MAYLLDSDAVALRSDGVVRVSGPDRLTYLNSLLSQELESAGPGGVADFLYLDAKGNALAVGRAVVRSDDVLLVVPQAVAASLTDALQRFTFLLQTSTDNLSDTWSVAAVRGVGAVDVPGAPAEALTAAQDGDGVLLRDPSGGVDLIGPAAWVQQRVDDLGLPRASDADWEAWRISAGQPAWGREILEGRRAQELGLLATHVHLRKGCYPGQESIAKIYNLGRPRRALAVIELAGPAAPGDPVAVAGKTGELTSVAPAGAAWVALALLPVDAEGQVLGDGTLTVGDVQGRVRHRVGEGLAIPGA